MPKLIQKKFSISQEQKRFLENYPKWGYSDQSSMVRDALNSFMNDAIVHERKILMERKARELSEDYTADEKLMVFSDLNDVEDL